MTTLNGTLSSLETALELRGRQDLWPIAIYPPGIERNGQLTKGKEPIGASWGVARWSEWDLRRRWRQYPNAGCGIGLGPERGPDGTWLADFEGDGPQAEESYLKLMGGEVAITMGWQSVRGFHRIHIVSGEQLLDLLSRAGAKEGKGLKAGVWHVPALPDLEIRVGGYKPDGSIKQVQSVCPPTPGTNGEPRQWLAREPISSLPDAAYAFLDSLAERAAVENNGQPDHVEAVAPAPPTWSTVGVTDGALSAEERCRRHLAGVGPAISGQRGHDHAMLAACLIVRFGIPNDITAWTLLNEYNARCQPQWSPGELRHKLDDAFRLETRCDFVNQDPPPWEGRGQADHEGGEQPGNQAESKESPSGSPTDNKGKAKPEPKPEPAPTQVDILLKIASVAKLFRDDANVTYAAVPVSGHVEVHAIYSTSFRQWLLRQYRAKKKGKMPTAEAVKTALDGLDAVAAARPIEQVFLRVGEANGKVYIDMGDPDWRAIEIDQAGWRIIGKHPVRFRRSDGMKPFPTPVHGGNLRDLRSFLNIPDEEFCLVVGWLAACLLPQGPFPILTLIGEQSCGKSTLADIAKRLVDPQKVKRSSPPKTPHDLAIAANNRWVLSYENLTSLPQWLSDMICMCSTGGGYSTRSLYKNREEEQFEFQRPAILNGISDFVTEHPDLTDRGVFLHMPPIPKENRRSEKEFWIKFEAALPTLIGSLLDVVVGGLAKQSETAGLPVPRMADFGRFAEAVWRGSGYPDNEFLDAYNANRKDAIASILEDSPVGVAIVKLMDARTEPWSGTATELLEALNGLVSEKAQKSKRWPKRPNTLSNAIRKVSPSLRENGIEVGEGTRANPSQPRRVVISMPAEGKGKSSATSSTSSSTPENRGNSYGRSKNEDRPVDDPPLPSGPTPTGRSSSTGRSMDDHENQGSSIANPSDTNSLDRTMDDMDDLHPFSSTDVSGATDDRDDKPPF